MHSARGDDPAAKHGLAPGGDSPTGDGQARGREPKDEQREPLEVTVSRTGGFAGMRREWRAEPPAEDAPRWIVLIDDCPWDLAHDGAHAGRGADRFVWSIRAARGGKARQASVAEGDLLGPWRELVDEVRRFAQQ